MDSLRSCLGLSTTRSEDREREPLLPRYEDATVMQRELHSKLHTYQMLRALSQGFMPTNEQTIVNLRTLLAADVLNPDNEGLSDSGRALVHYTKQWLKQFIELLQHKNAENQIQDFIWYLSKARIDVDMEDIVERTSRARVKADSAAAYKSLQTVGSLLLTNSDFRLFLSDLNTVGREVFRDTAFTLSDVSKQVGKELEPPKEEQEALKKPGEDAILAASTNDLQGQTSEVADVLKDGAAKVAQNAEQSLVQKVKGPEGDTMLNRLKQAVVKLRKRNDYSDSVTTLSLLIKRYAMVYSHVVDDAIKTTQNDVNTNDEMDIAGKNFWALLRSFGDQDQWQELEKRFQDVMDHSKSDPNFDALTKQIANSVQEMMTDPSFFDHAEERFQDLRAKSKTLASDSSLRDDFDGLLAQLNKTFQSVLADKDVMQLLDTTGKLMKILSPAHQYTNGDLISDAIQVFVPLLVQAIQYVPIPRLEVATPDVDLLLENLILEPGKTINNTSFLPYRLRLETYNDLDVHKARFGMTSSVTSFVRIHVDGLSIRGEEIGYWMRAHSGIFRLADEGIASFALDERGIDIEIDVEVGKDALDKILTLRSVRVHVHKLNYALRQSKFAWVAWLFKPILRPILRKTVEYAIATGISEALQFANRELLFARERLRATRIADPDDVRKFVKAVVTRLVPKPDPDLYTRVGVVQPGKGVFKGRYAPGSIVKLWNEEAAQAQQRIREYERDGWKNDIFDVPVVSPAAF